MKLELARDGATIAEACFPDGSSGCVKHSITGSPPQPSGYAFEGTPDEHFQH
ncbi:hypothetical protein ACTMU2_16915 [Cupriavidus basilensis]